MPELADLLASTHFPQFRKIHDCQDTGNDLALVADTPIPYPCDCVARDYKSDGTPLFDKLTGNIKDSIPNATMYFKFNGVIHAPINTILLINLVIPHPTFGDIYVESLDYKIGKNNVDVPFSLKTEIYNGTDSEAHLYGFDITIETNANSTLKARSVYART